MKKLLSISILFFSLSLLLFSFIAYAKQTSIPTYYPSAGGGYVKVHLINKSGVTCTTAGAGSIFADPTTGYLEICKKDGTFASYPGSCFNRFGNAAPTSRLLPQQLPDRQRGNT